MYSIYFILVLCPILYSHVLPISAISIFILFVFPTLVLSYLLYPFTNSSCISDFHFIVGSCFRDGCVDAHLVFHWFIL